jgi:hypothetical protein
MFQLSPGFDDEMRSRWMRDTTIAVATGRTVCHHAITVFFYRFRLRRVISGFE